MLIYANFCIYSKDFTDAEKLLMNRFGHHGMEIYRELNGLIARLKHRTYQIQLLILCIPDAGVVNSIESHRELLKEVDVIFLVKRGGQDQSKRLYKFFPRIILQVNRDEDILMAYTSIKASQKHQLRHDTFL